MDCVWTFYTCKHNISHISSSDNKIKPSVGTWNSLLIQSAGVLPRLNHNFPTARLFTHGISDTEDEQHLSMVWCLDDIFFRVGLICDACANTITEGNGGLWGGVVVNVRRLRFSSPQFTCKNLWRKTVNRQRCRVTLISPDIVCVGQEWESLTLIIEAVWFIRDGHLWKAQFETANRPFGILQSVCSWKGGRAQLFFWR